MCAAQVVPTAVLVHLTSNSAKSLQFTISWFVPFVSVGFADVERAGLGYVVPFGTIHDELLVAHNLCNKTDGQYLA